MISYETVFLYALAFTVVVETIILFIAARKILKIDKIKASNAMLLFLGFFCSFATIPYLWFVLPEFIKSRVLFTFVGEVSVTIIEGIIYYFVLKIKLRDAMLISLLCNLASFTLGLMIF